MRESAETPQVPVNQCDGCARGLPLEDGIHRGEGWDAIGCTADRYAPLHGTVAQAGEREQRRAIAKATGGASAY